MKTKSIFETNEYVATSFTIAGIDFTVIACEEGIAFLLLNEKLSPSHALPVLKPNAKEFQGVYGQLKEYFQGKRKSFQLKLAVEGTAFRIKVWKELIKVPYGETRSYKQIAKSIKNPNSVRAVGGANGANPVPILVPCHRVISHDGGIGGYSGGIAVKLKLLALEAKYK